MKEYGKVVKVDGDRVQVEIRRREACAHCGRCGGHVRFGTDLLVVDAVVEGEVSEGDVVELETSGSDFLKLSFYVYGLPLAAAGIGYFGGNALWGSAIAPYTALAAITGAFLWLRSYDAKARKKGMYLPKARKVELNS